MAVGKGDYGLFYRAMSGWLRGGTAERLVLGPADLAAPAARRLVLWPFDRPESRGRLMAVSVRRGEGEVLLLGFRSAPHWQVWVVAGWSGWECACPSPCNSWWRPAAMPSHLTTPNSP